MSCHCHRKLGAIQSQAPSFCKNKTKNNENCSSCAKRGRDYECRQDSDRFYRNNERFETLRYTQKGRTG